MHVDRYDNVWTIDEGSNLLIKSAPDGTLLMVIGKHPDPIDQLAKMPGVAPWSGANRPYSFHRPTDIGWDADDDGTAIGDANVARLQLDLRHGVKVP